MLTAHAACDDELRVLCLLHLSKIHLLRSCVLICSSSQTHCLLLSGIQCIYVAVACRYGDFAQLTYPNFIHFGRIPQPVCAICISKDCKLWSELSCDSLDCYTAVPILCGKHPTKELQTIDLLLQWAYRPGKPTDCKSCKASANSTELLSSPCREREPLYSTHGPITHLNAHSQLTGHRQVYD